LSIATTHELGIIHSRLQEGLDSEHHLLQSNETEINAGVEPNVEIGDRRNAAI
jgi:hypothetical protein